MMDDMYTYNLTTKTRNMRPHCMYMFMAMTLAL